MQIDLTIHYRDGGCEVIESPNFAHARGYIRALSNHRIITDAEHRRLLNALLAARREVARRPDPFSDVCLNL